ncbi:hypothetical protein [Erythrobacter aurantius]|uniref:hypothetical protein n=1 Tax=Erythrobacter aurantius TaxID=2909249 RepID=UPI00207A3BC9|nr:hypothetical protein [Erythrobacter aurantius]
MMFRTGLLAGCLALAACAQGDTASESEEATAPTAAEQEDAALAQAGEDIRRFLLQNYPDAAPGQYALAFYDLDGDGANEAIVHLISPFFCGSGGCNTLVLTQAGTMWREVANISVSRTPVGVADTAKNGWQDITVTIGGGGGEWGIAQLAFDGEAYPSNPTVEPAIMVETLGTELIAEEPEMLPLEAEAASTE